MPRQFVFTIITPEGSEAAGANEKSRSFLSLPDLFGTGLSLVSNLQTDLIIPSLYLLRYWPQHSGRIFFARSICIYSFLFEASQH